MPSCLNIMGVIETRNSTTHQLYARDLVITAVICFIGEKRTEQQPILDNLRKLGFHLQVLIGNYIILSDLLLYTYSEV